MKHGSVAIRCALKWMKNAMSGENYNGWTNYETWAVSHWIDDSQEACDYWKNQAAKQRKAAPACKQVLEGTWTVEDATKFNLADQLQEEFTDGSPLTTASLYSDLLNEALSEVNWHEIAEDYLPDLPEAKEPKPENSPDDFWGPPISVYTRAQAIADGVLVDATKMAQEAGIKHPTALTSAVWAEYVVVPEGVESQDEQGRLWDILFMFHLAAKRNADKSTLLFELLVRNDNTAPKPVILKAICGPGDTAEPVLTILLPYED
jgi:hypothetical protein